MEARHLLPPACRVALRGPLGGWELAACCPEPVVCHGMRPMCGAAARAVVLHHHQDRACRTSAILPAPPHPPSLAWRR
jgi:hypothetical protein